MMPRHEGPARIPCDERGDDGRLAEPETRHAHRHCQREDKGYLCKTSHAPSSKVTACGILSNQPAGIKDFRKDPHGAAGKTRADAVVGKDTACIPAAGNGMGGCREGYYSCKNLSVAGKMGLIEWTRVSLPISL